MTAIPFDVNNERVRASFFEHDLLTIVGKLHAQTPAVWGNMTSQHMLEHLVWAFECSTGKLVLRCQTPESVLERVKRFLYDDRSTPHDFKNPELGDDPPEYRFASFETARDRFKEELAHCLDYFRDHPDAVHVHPIFGPLGREEWQRSHFKHCYHHLLQFGLIEQLGSSTQ